MSVFLPGKNVGGAATALEGAHEFQSVVFDWKVPETIFLVCLVAV